MAQNLPNNNNTNNNQQIQNPNSNNIEENIETDPFQTNPNSPQNTSFLGPFSDTNSNPDSDIIHFEHDFDQINFVTDLFSPNDRYPSLNFGVQTENVGTFGDLTENMLNFGDQSENVSENIGELSENMVRIIGIEWDSNVPIFWNDQVGVNLDLEWEEVSDQRILERDGLGSVIERIEELSVSSEISNFEREELRDGLEEGDRDLEWEFLLAVNNLGRNLELEDESFGEYDELFGQLMQNGGTSKGSPPTAKSFVENLPIVVLSEEELKKDNIVCAVCKDDLSVEGSVTRLPCSHLYHEDCIVPWLCIRNTCPVCRHEFPTDDADYERRKSQEEADLSQDLLIRYAFEPIF